MFLMFNAINIDITKDSTEMENIRNIADEVGILGEEGGKNILVSAISSAKNKKMITGYEASQFFELMSENTDIIKTYKEKQKVIVGNDPIPVFSGQISIQYSPVYYRKKFPKEYNSPVISNKPGFSIIQDKFRIGLKGAENGSLSDIFYGTAGYQIFSILPGTDN